MEEQLLLPREEAGPLCRGEAGHSSLGCRVHRVQRQEVLRPGGDEVRALAGERELPRPGDAHQQPGAVLLHTGRVQQVLVRVQHKAATQKENQ